VEIKGEELAEFERGTSQDVDAPEKPHADVFPMREISLCGGLLLFNPVTLIIGIGLLWALTAWCTVDAASASANIANGKAWAARYFGWIYILSQNVWLIFLVWVYVKFGNKKLGKRDEKPEFSNGAYFSMIFSAGIGTGLFFYGVSEPLYHATGTYKHSRYEADLTLSRDTRDQHAINLTLFHWGLLGWVTYSLIAVTMGLAAYRHDLPFTLRSTLYPLLGRHAFGWIGDLVDGITVVTIVAGVVCDLGLGAAQIVEGFDNLGLIEVLSLAEGDNKLFQYRAITIWVVTIVAAISAVTGVARGIKYLSILGFSTGTFIWATVLFADKSEFIFNLFTQSIGFHIQWFFELSYASDAWPRLADHSIAQADEYLPNYPADEINGTGWELDQNGADPSWIGNWTLFYWGWWIAWAPFVGMFLARISRGRTIRSVINFTMTVPFGYIMLWFAVYGGASIRMQRRAEELETREVESFLYKDTFECFDVPAEFADPHLSPVCKYNALYPGYSWFILMNQYSDIATFLNVGSIIAMVIYFVTSSDSGSLVTDALIANGKEGQHPAQRALWAITQGAVASALLYTGGTSVMYVYQNVLVVIGMPYTIIVCLMTASLYKMLVQDEVYLRHGIEWHSEAVTDSKTHFAYPIYGGVFDIVEAIISFGKPNPLRGYRGVPAGSAVTFLTSIPLPFLAYARASRSAGDSPGETTFWTAFNAVTFAATVLILLSSLALEEGSLVHVIATVTYICFAGSIMRLRHAFRQRYNILHANIIEDFFCGFLLYPQALAQMTHHASVETPHGDQLEE